MVWDTQGPSAGPDRTDNGPGQTEAVLINKTSPVLQSEKPEVGARILLCITHSVGQGSMSKITVQ